MLSCRKYAALIAPFAENKLPEPDRKRIAAHVANCASCREAVETHRMMAALLSSHRPAAPEPAADLWSRIEAEITAAPVGHAALGEPAAVRRSWLSSLPSLPRPRFRVAMPTAGLVAAGLTLVFLFAGTDSDVRARRKAVEVVIVGLVGPSLQSKEKVAEATVAVKQPLIVETPGAETEIAAVESSVRAPAASKQAQTPPPAADYDPFRTLEERGRVAAAAAPPSDGAGRVNDALAKVIATTSARRAQIAAQGAGVSDAKKRAAYGRSIAQRQRSRQAMTPGVVESTMALSMARNPERVNREGGMADLGSGTLPASRPGSGLAASIPAPAGDESPLPKTPGNAGPFAPAIPDGFGGIAAARPEAPGTASHPAGPAPAAIPEGGVASDEAFPVRGISAPVTTLTSGKTPNARASAADAAIRANRQRTLFSYGNR